MALTKMLNKCINGCGFRIVNKRFYKTRYFDNESERLMQPIKTPYLDLIENYPTSADKRKGIENQILFIEMVHWLGLEKSRPYKILDIGGRGGLFAYFCKKYGHDAYVSDIPGVLQKTPNKELLALFGVKSIDLMIEPFSQINIGASSFDLVTGFRTRFHSKLPFETGKEYEEHWGKEEWDFFLDDLSTNVLNKQGRIFFMLNRLQEKEKGDYIPENLAALFRSKGGILTDKFLHFPLPPKRSK